MTKETKKAPATVQEKAPATVQEKAPATVQEKEALLNTIKDLKKQLIVIIQGGKIKQSLVSEWLVLCHKYVALYNDKSFLINLFFEKYGKTNLFNALQLRQYYLDNDVAIDYNVKKQRLYIIGDIGAISETFTEYKKRLSKERRQELDNLTEKEKIAKVFKSKIDAMTKAQKAYLLDLIK